jgi:hypothetical protein
VTAGLGLVKMSENAGFKFYDEADLFIFTLQTDLYEPEMLSVARVTHEKSLPLSRPASTPEKILLGM